MSSKENLVKTYQKKTDKEHVLDEDSEAIILPANIWHEAVAIENNTVFNSLFLKDTEY